MDVSSPTKRRRRSPRNHSGVLPSIAEQRKTEEEINHAQNKVPETEEFHVDTEQTRKMSRVDEGEEARVPGVRESEDQVSTDDGETKTRRKMRSATVRNCSLSEEKEIQRSSQELRRGRSAKSAEDVMIDNNKKEVKSDRKRLTEEDNRHGEETEVKREKLVREAGVDSQESIHETCSQGSSRRTRSGLAQKERNVSTKAEKRNRESEDVLEMFEESKRSSQDESHKAEIEEVLQKERPIKMKNPTFATHSQETIENKRSAEKEELIKDEPKEESATERKASLRRGRSVSVAKPKTETKLVKCETYSEILVKEEVVNVEEKKADEESAETDSQGKTEAANEFDGITTELKTPQNKISQKPLHLRIKKTVVVEDMRELNTRVPPKCLAPKYVPPTRGVCGRTKEKTSPGPRGEYAQFDSYEEGLADKFKYQFEYATLRNMQRAKVQRAEEEKRQAQRNKRPQIMLTEKQFLHRQFLSDKYRAARYMRMEFDLIRLNCELKQSMQIGNIDVEKCLKCLAQLRNLQVLPKMLHKYPDVILTVTKMLDYQEQESIMVAALEVIHHFQPLFMMPDSQELDDVLLTESNGQQEEFIKEFGIEMMKNELKWQTLNYHQFTINILHLPGHTADNEEDEDDMQEVPVQRTRLSRSAKKEISYSMIENPEDLQVVPEAEVGSEDVSEYEESDYSGQEDEEFYLG